MPQETTSPSETTLTGDLASSRQVDRNAVEDEPKLDLIELATVLMRGKKTILRAGLAMAVFMAIIAFVVLKPTYTAEAVFIPPQSSPGSASSQLLGQLSSSLGAAGALSGLKSPGDVYLGILASRTIADRIIQRFNLATVYKTKKLMDTEKALKGHSKFVSGKDSLITITVTDRDAKRATAIANGYLDELRQQNGHLALTESAQRRLFFEQQLEHEKNSLADAEVDLKKTQEQTGLIAPVGQAQVEIETLAQVRAQITSRQVELSALQQAATNENPQVIRLQTEISGLQQELQRLQNDPSKRQPGNVQLPTARVPELALEYIRKQREVKYHEVLFELIAKQYETARLDESRDAPLLQVVDQAIVPDKKSGPPRLLLVIAGLFFGLFAGSIVVLLRHFFATLRQDETQGPKLQALRRAASLRS